MQSLSALLLKCRYCLLVCLYLHWSLPVVVADFRREENALKIFRSALESVDVYESQSGEAIVQVTLVGNGPPPPMHPFSKRAISPEY